MSNESKVVDVEVVDTDTMEKEFTEKTETVVEPVTETKSMEIDPDKSIDEFKSQFQDILESNSHNNNQIAESIKLLDLDESKDMVVKTVQFFGEMQDKEDGGNFFTRLGSKIPGINKLIDTTSDKFSEARLEGKSIADVSKELLEALQNKKVSVEEVTVSLIGLCENMRESYDSLEDMITEINGRLALDSDGDEETNNTSKDSFLLKGLKAEILSLRQIIKENIQTGQGVVMAAEGATTQISTMIPRLRVQVTDAMSIRAVVGKLNDLTDMFDMINETSAMLRDDNRNNVEKSLLRIIKTSAPTDDQLAIMANSDKEHKALVNKVNQAMANAIGQREKAIHVLDDMVGEGKGIEATTQFALTSGK